MEKDTKMTLNIKKKRLRCNKRLMNRITKWKYKNRFLILTLFQPRFYKTIFKKIFII